MSYDVLVVGSGAGGGVAAWKLARNGFKVCLVERGPKFDPQKDYVLNYPDWEWREDPLQSAQMDEQTIDLAYTTPLRESNTVNSRAPFTYHRVIGVGGSTLHYQGEAHRFAEHAFQPKTLFGWGSDWPLRYTDLEPYYRKMEELLGVAGERGNPFKSDRGEFPLPAHPLSGKSRILADSALEAGMTLQTNTLALPSMSFDGRLPCQHSGGCVLGCIFNAKSSVDQVFVPAAEKTGNLELLTDTRAMKIITDASGAIAGVQCVRSGQSLRISAERYLLAAGAIETPRLLLHSKSTQYPEGFANAHDQVGRYFMETVGSSVPLMLRDPIHVYRGPPIEARVWDFCYPADTDSLGFVLGVMSSLERSAGPTRHAMRVSGLGRKHKQQVRETFGRELQLFGIAEQEPISSNRIFLSDQKDDLGVPKVKVHSVYGARDRNTIKQMEKRLLDWARATSTEYVGRPRSTEIKSSATHVGGTCRMGEDPRHSVVDGFGQLHGQSDVYICDGSVLPSQGAGDSPSLTIQALALRTAEKIAADLRN